MLAALFTDRLDHTRTGPRVVRARKLVLGPDNVVVFLPASSPAPSAPCERSCSRRLSVAAAAPLRGCVLKAVHQQDALAVFGERILKSKVSILVDKIAMLRVPR